jgi:hypothetical protein
MYIAETNAVAVVIVFEPHSCRGILHTTLCDKVCQGLATGWRIHCMIVTCLKDPEGYRVVLIFSSK